MSVTNNQVVNFNHNNITIVKSRRNTECSKRQLDVLQNQWGKNEYNGFLSKSTRRKIVKMLNTWAQSVYAYKLCTTSYEQRNKRNLRFLTLTLPERQSIVDNDVKRKALIPFISELKRMFHVEHYFWRAESQKNGNIHFHLVIDAFVDKSAVNFLWDSHLWNAGLLSYAPIYQIDYHSASTRIEAIQGEDAVAGYVTKYVTKDDGGRKIFGRIWGCSDSLRRLVLPAQNYTNEVAEWLQPVLDKLKEPKIVTDVYIVYSVNFLGDVRFQTNPLRVWLLSTLLDNYYYLYECDNFWIIE